MSTPKFRSEFARNIIKNSISSNADEAIKEWCIISEEKKDNPNFEKCICGQPILNIIYIYNDLTRNVLMVGSNCQTKFNISAKNEDYYLFIKDKININNNLEKSIIEHFELKIKNIYEYNSLPYEIDKACKIFNFDSLKQIKSQFENNKINNIIEYFMQECQTKFLIIKNKLEKGEHVNIKCNCLVDLLKVLQEYKVIYLDIKDLEMIKLQINNNLLLIQEKIDNIKIAYYESNIELGLYKKVLEKLKNNTMCNFQNIKERALKLYVEDSIEKLNVQLNIDLLNSVLNYDKTALEPYIEEHKTVIFQHYKSIFDTFIEEYKQQLKFHIVPNYDKLLEYKNIPLVKYVMNIDKIIINLNNLKFPDITYCKCDYKYYDYTHDIMDIVVTTGTVYEIMTYGCPNIFLKAMFKKHNYCKLDEHKTKYCVLITLYKNNTILDARRSNDRDVRRLDFNAYTAKLSYDRDMYDSD